MSNTLRKCIPVQRIISCQVYGIVRKKRHLFCVTRSVKRDMITTDEKFYHIGLRASNASAEASSRGSAKR